MTESQSGGIRRRESGDAQPTAGQDSEATSKETLEDVEESTKNSDSTSDNWSGGSSLPSPDGQVEDGTEGRADGSETGGPM